ncbi:hypothetical protein JD844_020997 [Phrynosoma platyrhinos]|uniref:Uncharacterized protein n=1 Tax=Phrynosoma platyrhinos TaxID=52577 RepID=A0ABQ7ST01_PHRPL|nr:hypothetical protein JD844_020997 [Phrynosoma platyrhinos]
MASGTSSLLPPDFKLPGMHGSIQFLCKKVVPFINELPIDNRKMVCIFEAEAYKLIGHQFSTGRQLYCEIKVMEAHCLASEGKENQLLTSVNASAAGQGKEASKRSVMISEAGRKKWFWHLLQT